MELHELESAWQGATRQLERQALRIASLEAATLRTRLRARLGFVALGQWIELAVGVAIAVLAGGYWYDHLGTTHLVAYGLAVHAYGIALIGFAAAHLVRLAAVDPAGPVSAVQARLLSVKRLRIRAEQVLLVFGAVGWVPLLFIAANAVGFDAWRVHPAYVLANLAVGVALASCVVAAIRWRPAWFEHSAMGGRWRAIERDLAEAEAFARD